MLPPAVMGTATTDRKQIFKENILKFIFIKIQFDNTTFYPPCWVGMPITDNKQIFKKRKKVSEMTLLFSEAKEISFVTDGVNFS